MAKHPPPRDVADLLVGWRNGDPGAFERLIPLVYDELHRVAHAHLRRESLGHTLQTTVLVHEAYLRLVERAIAVARERKEKSLELRALMSLYRAVRARARSDRREQVRAQLAQTYGWFTEGLETADLREARSLLG